MPYNFILSGLSPEFRLSVLTVFIILKGDKQFILATSLDPLPILKELSTTLPSPTLPML